MRLTWTTETYRIHGLPTSFEPTVEVAIQFYHPDDRPDVRADVESALAGERFDSTYRLYRADGEIRWVRSMGVPVYEGEDVVAVRGAYQDVTEQKEREDAIREFEQAVESAGHAIFITERNGTITYVNPAFEEVTGYAAEEAIGRDPSLLKSGQMDQEYYRHLWSTILSGAVWSEPIVNKRKSGEHYHASETIAPIEGDDGTVRGFVAIQTDVTEQVHTKEKLETFREIVQRLEDPIMLQDESGAFEVVNDAVGEYAGLPKSDLIGRDEFAFMDDTAARRVSQMKERAVEREETVTYELDPTFPTKGRRSFVTTRYPHYDEEGVVDGTVAICRDVTEQAEREHQLRVLDRILRHNLYNKMNLILGHAELLEGQVGADARRSVEKITETGNDLVDLADKERRIVELLTDDSAPVRLDVAELLDDLLESLRESHPDAEIDVDCPATVEVEAIPELREALAEVLGNAVDHAGATRGCRFESFARTTRSSSLWPTTARGSRRWSGRPRAARRGSPRCFTARGSVSSSSTTSRSALAGRSASIRPTVTAGGGTSSTAHTGNSTARSSSSRFRRGTRRTRRGTESARRSRRRWRGGVSPRPRDGVTPPRSAVRAPPRPSRRGRGSRSTRAA
nr:PAS domain S-box protein [Halobellus rufus]